MMHYIRKISLALALLWGTFIHHTQASQTFLYLFYDGTRAGEKSQVLGIAIALKEQLPAETTQKKFDFKDHSTRHFLKF